MFSKNLKYYRLKNNLTKSALASMVGVSSMAITNYENGDRRPDMATIKALAEALGVNISDFLAVRNRNLIFVHEEFRKNTKLTKSQQEYVREAVEEYFSRFYEAVELLGGEVLTESPKIHEINVRPDLEENARLLRKYLSLSDRGPVGNLIELLENSGILVYLVDIENDSFSGINGNISGRPYIAVNKNMTAERIRTTICHELAHIAFLWPEDADDKEIEKNATEIAGAFLFPKADALRELGIQRRFITTDMYMVCREYGIAMSMLVVRAHLCGIISDSVYRNYFIQNGGGKSEKSRIAIDLPTLFEQLVYRAVNEQEISIQKGAELLKLPFDIVAENCCAAGV